MTALSPSRLPSISIFSPLKYQPFLPWTISLTAQTSSSDFSQGQYIVVAHIPRPNVFLCLPAIFLIESENAKQSHVSAFQGLDEAV